jgi:hypothetical protein
LPYRGKSGELLFALTLDGSQAAPFDAETVGIMVAGFTAEEEK